MNNKIVVISGAGGGIGQAAAIAYASRHYFVVGVDLNQTGLHSTQTQVENNGGHFEGHVANVSSEPELSTIFSSVMEEHGSVDCVVSCAGVARTGLVHDMPLADWEMQISVNLTGTYLLARCAMKVFLKQGAGNFVAVGSDAAVRGASGYAAYCASKHGVIGLVRCLALDYGKHGIRANAICPGFVETEMMKSLFAEADDPDEQQASFMREVPMGRFAAPREVADAILHLSSDNASYTNGMVYCIDGGVTAGYFEG